MRGAANVFGCESDRSALTTELTDYLSAWANEALAIGVSSNSANAS